MLNRLWYAQWVEVLSVRMQSVENVAVNTPVFGQRVH